MQSIREKNLAISQREGLREGEKTGGGDRGRAQ